MENEFPMLRGINCKNGYIDDNERPQPTLYYFNYKVPILRGDDYREESISWYQCDRAIEILLEQKKADTEEYQFKYGIAVTDHSVIKYLKNNVRWKHLFSYEPDPLDENPYHGNMLLKSICEYAEMKALAGHIATVSSVLVRRIGSEAPTVRADNER